MITWAPVSHCCLLHCRSAVHLATLLPGCCLQMSPLVHTCNADRQQLSLQAWQSQPWQRSAKLRIEHNPNSQRSDQVSRQPVRGQLHEGVAKQATLTGQLGYEDFTAYAYQTINSWVTAWA